MMDELIALMNEGKQTCPTVLLQGYPYTGFARIDTKWGLRLPLKDVSLRKDLYWDVRMFSPQGEWHLWKKNARGEWGKRFAAPNTWNIIERLHRLWGASVPLRDGEWFRYQEANGATIYLPEEIRNPALKVHLRVERDVRGKDEKRTNLAGIVDAMICEIVEVP